jgi:hypothetical protein
MKRAVIVANLLLCSLSQAYASTHAVMIYRDTIRPNGHKRSDAIGNSNLNFFSATARPGSPATRRTPRPSRIA